MQVPGHNESKGHHEASVKKLEVEILPLPVVSTGIQCGLEFVDTHLTHPVTTNTETPRRAGPTLNIDATSFLEKAVCLQTNLKDTSIRNYNLPFAKSEV